MLTKDKEYYENLKKICIEVLKSKTKDLKDFRYDFCEDDFILSEFIRDGGKIRCLMVSNNNGTFYVYILTKEEIVKEKFGDSDNEIVYNIKGTTDKLIVVEV